MNNQSDEELGALGSKLFSDAITPNAEQILRIGMPGGIPVVVFEPSDDWAKTLASWGWQGEQVFRMPSYARKSLMERSTDPKTREWFDVGTYSDEDPLRIFLVYGDETALVNYELRSFLCTRPQEHNGWYCDVKPGKADSEPN